MYQYIGDLIYLKSAFDLVGRCLSLDTEGTMYRCEQEKKIPRPSIYTVFSVGRVTF